MSNQQTREMALQLAVSAHADDLAATAHRPEHQVDGGVLDKAERYLEFLSSDG